MCPSPKPPKPVTPASPPAAPLPISEEPDIGSTRRKQNIRLFGSDTPSYRQRDDDTGPASQPKGNGGGGLRM